VKGIKVLATRIDPADPRTFRDMADKLRDRMQSGVVALGGEKDGKVLLLVAVTRDLVEKGHKASDLIREMAKEVGGSGGGKPDMAQAGGTDPSRIDQALQKIFDLM
jgi:alanyl-tRNA synthetase